MALECVGIPMFNHVETPGFLGEGFRNEGVPPRWLRSAKERKHATHAKPTTPAHSMRTAIAVAALVACLAIVAQPLLVAMLSALPAPFQRQLLSFHSSAKQNNGDRGFTTEEDASILMQARCKAGAAAQSSAARPHLDSYYLPLARAPQEERVRSRASLADDRSGSA